MDTGGNPWALRDAYNGAVVRQPWNPHRGAGSTEKRPALRGSDGPGGPGLSGPSTGLSLRAPGESVEPGARVVTPYVPAKLKRARYKRALFDLAGGPGFEPGLTESESVVLPLDDPPFKAVASGKSQVARNGCDSALANRGAFSTIPRLPSSKPSPRFRATIRLVRRSSAACEAHRTIPWRS